MCKNAVRGWVCPATEMCARRDARMAASVEGGRLAPRCCDAQSRSGPPSDPTARRPPQGVSTAAAALSPPGNARTSFAPRGAPRSSAPERSARVTRVPQCAWSVKTNENDTRYTPKSGCTAPRPPQVTTPKIETVSGFTCACVSFGAFYGGVVTLFRRVGFSTPAGSPPQAMFSSSWLNPGQILNNLFGPLQPAVVDIASYGA